KRAQDPSQVARVVMNAALYGLDTPYGHPSDGLVASAPHVDLPGVKGFYASHFRPDKATLVVAGDVTRAEVEAMVLSTLGTWSAPAGAAPPEPAVTAVRHE